MLKNSRHEKRKYLTTISNVMTVAAISLKNE